MTKVMLVSVLWMTTTLTDGGPKQILTAVI
jgi:hypothetical protein